MAEEIGGKQFVGASREKYFEEKNADERTIKLGEVCEELVREIKLLKMEVALLKVHAHDDIGQLMVPFPDKVNVLDERYFWKNPLGREKPPRNY